MNKILKEKISESVSSVLPITIIVLLLSVTVTPMPVGTMVLFLTGAALLIVGMALFSLGTDVSMTPMGEGIGAQLPRTKNLFIVILITLIIGVLITIAEPDLQVLAGQVPSIPNNVLIWTVAGGVGLFFVLAMLRTLFKMLLASTKGLGFMIQQARGIFRLDIIIVGMIVIAITGAVLSSIIQFIGRKLIKGGRRG